MVRRAPYPEPDGWGQTGSEERPGGLAWLPSPHSLHATFTRPAGNSVGVQQPADPMDNILSFRERERNGGVHGWNRQEELRGTG